MRSFPSISNISLPLCVSPGTWEPGPVPFRFIVVGERVPGADTIFRTFCRAQSHPENHAHRGGV